MAYKLTNDTIDATLVNFQQSIEIETGYIIEHEWLSDKDLILNYDVRCRADEEKLSDACDCLVALGDAIAGVLNAFSPSDGMEWVVFSDFTVWRNGEELDADEPTKVGDIIQLRVSLENKVDSDNDYTIKRIREILNDEDLCDRAMLSEIEELIGEE